jgi:hypothetical protein
VAGSVLRRSGSVEEAVRVSAAQTRQAISFVTALCNIARPNFE